MKINAKDERDGVVILRLHGKLFGGPDADTMKKAITELADEGRINLIVDLKDVSVVNSTGLGILVSSLTTVRRNEGNLKLLHVPTRIASALQMTWLTKVFELHEDEDKAVASFSG